MKRSVKKGDEVVVITGSSKGAKGKVLVEGVNVRKFHERKSEKNPDGAIVEREAPIHISNVMSAERAKK